MKNIIAESTPQQLIFNCVEKIKSTKTMLSCDVVRLELLDCQISKPDIWKDPKEAASLMKEHQKISSILNQFNLFSNQINFYHELSEELPEELESQMLNIVKLYNDLSEFELHQMMRDPLSDNAAILTINAGAGGLEAANWVTMLLRMYLRWADNYKFNAEYLDMNPSEEHSSICTDAVSIRIEGPYAYGFLKGESGVHRLIRNSPFNAGNARHTSFAAVAVIPDIEDVIDIKIDEKDIEITTMRSSGPGGQAVNKIESAVRIKHIPTGVVINSRSERDQLQNKKIAFKMLKAKLYEIELKKKLSEKEKVFSEQKESAFGNQIRTYTINPYSLVKDHRTEFEIKNAESILDGNIQEFILSFLKKQF